MKRFLLLGLLLAACTDHPTDLGLAGPPVGVQVVSARGASPLAITIRVTDQAIAGVPGVVVHWSTPTGTLSATGDTTDQAGEASVTLTSGTGLIPVTVTADGIGSTSITATVQPISGDIVFRYLDAGSYHGCGITTTEQLLCWGYGADGQLGYNSTSPTLFPSLIPGDPHYRLVSGGRFHSCGVTLSLLAYCWGSNADGRLGDGGGASQSASPVAVVAGTGVQLSFQAQQSGQVSSCGIDLSQHLWCWGYDGEGEVGDGGPMVPGESVPAPALIDPGTAYKAVAVGGLHACAVSTGGAASCWGFNASGQLGDGTTGSASAPVAVAGGHGFRTDPAVIFHSPDPDFPLPVGPFIAAGYDHTCAVSTDGSTYCWGLNQDGQLGDGTFAARTTPVAISGSFTAVTAGQRHSCALTAAGAAFCWGDNTFGQLGDGSTDRRNAPTAVAGGLTFAYLKAGDLSTCGVTTAGTAYCWGDNEYGQLGDGTTTAGLSPVKVAFQP